MRCLIVQIRSGTGWRNISIGFDTYEQAKRWACHLAYIDFRIVENEKEVTQ